MKKSKIKSRSLLYSVVGVTIAAFSVLSMVAQLPPKSIARIDIESFQGGILKGEDQEPAETPTLEQPDTPKMGGVSVKGFVLGDNPYHILSHSVQELLASGKFNYGKANPTLYSTGGSGPTGGVPVDVASTPSGGDESGTQPSTTGIVLETPTGDITLEYTSGKLPVKTELYKVDKIYGMIGTDFHYGIDVSSDGIDGAEIFSILPGIISNVGETEEYGNYVVVNHGSISSLYAHMKPSIPVAIGDRVFMGDTLGYVGDTGIAETPHLHFEMDVDGVRFNPEIFISKIR